MSVGTRFPKSTRSAFEVSVGDTIGELERYRHSRVNIQLETFRQPNGRHRLAWRATLTLGNLGVLEPREYSVAVGCVSKVTSDPFASLYNALIDLLRKVENDAQSKFWLRDPQA